MKNREIDILEQKMQPHDTDTEWSVLSDLMHDNNRLAQYGDMLSESLFYHEKEKAMFRCIAGVITSGSITDINSLFDYAQRHDIGYELFRNDFLEILPKANKATVEQDIERLVDMGRRRMFWRMGMEIVQRSLDLSGSLEEQMDAMQGVINEMQSGSATDGTKDLRTVIENVETAAEENRHGKRTYYPTGFWLFDSRYVFRPDTMTVIAAFTSVGKSALAMNIVYSVAGHGIPCAYYSLEMSSTELASRGLSKAANLSSSEIINKPLTEEQMKRLHEAGAKQKGLPIYFDDRATADYDRTIRSIRTMAKVNGVKLAVIDYLQIYAQVSDDQEQSISYMARTAKNVAKELGIAIILISQLNRSGLHPSMKMLRGSGQIEEAADNVILIDRPDAYPDNKVTKYEGEYRNASVNGTAKFILSKGRGIGTGSQLVAFEKEHTLFKEIPKPEEAGHYEEQTEGLPF